MGLTSPYRPDDRDALRAALRFAQSRAQLAVVFGGQVLGGALKLTDLVGNRTNHLRGLTVPSGTGLGGRAVADGRLTVVHDYLLDQGITHDYDGPVRAEGLRSVVAVPVRVRDQVRAVIYGAVRQATPVGDRGTEVLLEAARGLSTELTIRDEVDRRVAMADSMASDRVPLSDPAALEEVRAVHAELRSIANSTADPVLRAQLEHSAGRLAGVGATQSPSVHLSARETDVLSYAALGCTNSEIAERLSLQPETVKSYLKSAMRKFDSHTRHEAVVAARRQGLLP
ncbi:LuxR C-terminal-related transcriptional regulator [Smaragdicoccus niigatensis]|uniref:LuxR C-terminal-related transcriptional regulator n=1 Tax=Smaragdicoccus niigatensis TaxID=359359 RepID=UPI000365F9F5|nr:LuxR C-terminal-related transcriptional regulator [Smaragdicoccus niigatensis]